MKMASSATASSSSHVYSNRLGACAASTTQTVEALASDNNVTRDSVVQQQQQHQKQLYHHQTRHQSPTTSVEIKSGNDQQRSCNALSNGVNFADNNILLPVPPPQHHQQQQTKQVVNLEPSLNVSITPSGSAPSNTNNNNKQHRIRGSLESDIDDIDEDIDIDIGYRSGSSDLLSTNSNLSHNSPELSETTSDDEVGQAPMTVNRGVASKVTAMATSTRRSSTSAAVATGLKDDNKPLRGRQSKARDVDEVVAPKRARGSRSAKSPSGEDDNDTNVISLRNRTLGDTSSPTPEPNPSQRRPRRSKQQRTSSGEGHQDIDDSAQHSEHYLRHLDYHHQQRPNPSVQSYFPLKTIGSVCELFRSQVANNDQPPNLVLLSIVIGLIEEKITNGSFGVDDEDTVHLYTVDHTQQQSYGSESRRGNLSPTEASPAPSLGGRTSFDIPIPIVRWSTVETLVNKFTKQIQESIDLSNSPRKVTTSELIKKITDLLMGNIHRSHCKDRAHLQTLYSYLTEGRLDSYGFAYAVLVTCQTLGFNDMRLVMSEDHVWGVLADGETVEVTWHSKGTEDRIGEPVPAADAGNWLYLHGNTMVCDQHQVVATLVSAMNLSINALQDSRELALLQQQLLWILYDYGHLERYPMALGNLADLEDACGPAGLGRRSALDLFHQSIEAAKQYYHDCHVYPYTYLGGYYFRVGAYREAFRLWAEAAGVIRKYNYSREDEEIYKEFQEIANDLIPHIAKTASPRLGPSGEPPLLQDAECFACLLRFYDGLCAWEEGSSTPVLHIGWAKPLVSTMAKFPHHVRARVEIRVELADMFDDNEEAAGSANGSEFGDGEGSDDGKMLTIGERRRMRATSFGSRDQLPLRNVINNANSSTASVTSPGDNKENQEVVVANGVGYYSGKTSLDNELGVWVVLGSKKMAGLKNLLTSDKLNTSAIQLQLTAQSQVNLANKRTSVNSMTLGMASTGRTPAHSNWTIGTPKHSANAFSEIDMSGHWKDKSVVGGSTVPKRHRKE